MDTCPVCKFVDEQVEGDPRFEVIDISQHVRKLKEFLHLRDTNPVFEKTKQSGGVGIPCFVLEDGTVTLSPEDVGLSSKPVTEGATCNIDGTGC